MMDRCENVRRGKNNGDAHADNRMLTFQAFVIDNETTALPMKKLQGAALFVDEEID